MEVSDQLANLGAMISGEIQKSVQKNQFQAALPVMQDIFKQSMTDFDAGRSGEGFSKIMGVAMQFPDNPLIQNISQMAFTAGKAASDDYMAKSKSAYSLTDLALIKSLGLGVGQDTEDDTTPTSPTTPTTQQPQPKPPANLDEDVVTLTAVEVPLPGTDEAYEQEIADSFAITEDKVSKEGVGSALASSNFFSDDDVSGIIKSDKFNYLQLPAEAAKYLDGANAIAVPIDIEGLRQEGVSLKGNIGTINYKNVYDSESAKNERKQFMSKLSSAVSALDNSDEVKTLIKHFGGFKNIPAPRTDPKSGDFVWQIEQEGKKKPIRLPSGKGDSLGLKEYFSLAPEAANQAAILGMPMIRPNMPAPAQEMLIDKAFKELGPNATDEQIAQRVKQLSNQKK